ncbi:MAG: hypothetical protein LBD93_04250 [Treponema sp.]|jgi:hypothetical protein|nr:hypothetical protein [Treponema sp.]
MDNKEIGAIFQLFDKVFKCLMRLSDRAIIHFINGLFGTQYPPDSKLTRPGTETVNPYLKHSLADMVMVINREYSYVLEAQIKNDPDMGVRILQYMLNEGWRGAQVEGSGIRIRLPAARVIYWETSKGTPDKERICFEFPDGHTYIYEVVSFKFPEYSVGMLEAGDLGLLLPFCMLKYRKAVKGAKSREAREALAKEVGALIEEVVGAVRRSEDRGRMSHWDGENVLRLIRRMQRELYGGYKEFREVECMWEDIEVIDYEGLMRKAEEADRKVEQAIQEKEQATWKAEQAARKLRKMGVSEEQVVAAGLLEIAEQ